MVCPTCYCFDVHDKLSADGASGRARAGVGLVHVLGVRRGGARSQLPRDEREPGQVPLLPQAVGLPVQVRARALRRLRPLRARLQGRDQPARRHRRAAERGCRADEHRAYRELRRQPLPPVAGAHHLDHRPDRQGEALRAAAHRRGRSARRSSSTPGQFVEVSIFGVGEAPISISSAPSQAGVHRAVRAQGRRRHRRAARQAVRRHRRAARTRSAAGSRSRR